MKMTSLLARLYSHALTRISKFFSRETYVSLRPDLLSLPDELLCEILYFLDWKSLLVIKLTCKRIHIFTKSHSFWDSQASELSLTTGSSILEEPASYYSVEELQKRVIQRLRVRERWRNPDPFLFQEFRVKHTTKARMSLLPGGRWLLDNISGYVYTLDLDNPQFGPQLLFEERHILWTGRGVDPLSGYAIWIDPSTPRLSIRIALHNDTGSAAREPSRICIYQLDLNGRGAEANWAVKPMATLKCPGPCLKNGIQIEGDCIIEQCIYKNDGIESRKVHVFLYSNSGVRVVVWEYPTASTIILLPGCRLVAITDSDACAEFFKIRVSNEPGSLVLEQSFRISLQAGPTSSVSRVHVDHCFSYIMAACKGSFVALRIPHETGVPPVVKRFDRDDTDEYCLSMGFSLTVVLRKDRSMDFIAYDLRDDEMQVASTAKLWMFPGAGFLRLVVFDVGSGRIVMRNHKAEFFVEI